MLALRSARPDTLDWLVLDAPNGLKALSHEHRHGWGIAQYVGRRPVVALGTLPAWEDPEFEDVARSVEGDCLLAHVRRASMGEVRVENSHPFHNGRWLFAHNGTVRGFEKLREKLDSLIANEFRALLAGNTDSERCFGLFLTCLARLGALEQPPLEVIACALAETIALLRELSPDPTTALTFLATDGICLVGARSGEKELGYLANPGERLLIASEAPASDVPWTQLEDGEVVGADARLRIHRWRMDGGCLRSR
jgi:glutamine amidotransferase